MRHLFTITGLILIISCNETTKSPTLNPSFLTKEIQIDTDTLIESVHIYQGYLLFLDANGRFLVFDTSFKRLDTLETKLNRYKPDYIYEHRDSMFFTKKEKDYFLDSKFNLKKFNKKFRRYGTGLYEDSVYYVYGCCIGEFGGSVFFLDKRANRTYSYFATCARQILKFNDEYLVSNNLSHLGGSTSFLFIKNVSAIYELKDDKQKNFCNWYVEVDSIKDTWHTKKTDNLRFFMGPRSTMTLMNFAYRDSLYSILTNDSLTYIAVHRADSLETRQIVIDKSISFHYNTVKKLGKGTICFYQMSEGSPVEAFFKTGNDCGLIYTTENIIYLLSFRRKQT